MTRGAVVGLALLVGGCAPSFPPPHMGVGFAPETHGTLGGGIAGSGTALARVDGGAALGELTAALGIHGDVDIVGHFQAASSVNTTGYLGGAGLRWQAYADAPLRVMLAAGVDGGLLAVDGRIRRGALDVKEPGTTDTAVAGPWGTFSLGLRMADFAILYMDNTYEFLWNERFPEAHWWIGTLGVDLDATPFLSWFFAVGGSYRQSSFEEGGGMHVGTGLAFHWGDEHHRHR